MVKGLIMGGIAFAATFAAARQMDGIFKDIARYDRLATMSGSPTLGQKLLSGVFGAFGQFGTDRGKQAQDLFENLAGDLIRYARIKAM